jgi:integrase
MIASDITPQNIEEAIAGFPPSSKNAVLAYLRAAFNFGIRTGVVHENPVDRLEFTKIIRDQTEVLTPETVENLLLDAMNNDLGLIPFLVLAFYGGVRPDGELQKVLWSDLNLNAKKHHLTIRSTVAKKRRKRWIDLSGNALAWLSEYQARGGQMDGRITPFSASTLRRKRRRNALAAGLAEWPQQAARHTWFHAGWRSTATSTGWSSRPDTNQLRLCFSTIIKRSPQRQRLPSSTFSRQPAKNDALYRSTRDSSF